MTATDRYRHLLVPLDGTPMAEAVMPAVADLARRFGSRVTLLHVIEHGAPATIHGAPHLAGAGEAERYLADIAGKWLGEVQNVAWHVHGEEVRQIARGLADHVAELAPDLIVMCSHGAHGLRDALMGNLALRVVGLGAAPVLLLRLGATGLAHWPLGTVLVPLDGKPAHEAGLEPATVLARACGARVRFVCVVPTSGDLRGAEAASGELLPGVTRAILQLAEEDSANYLSTRIDEAKTQGIDAEGCVARGDPSDRIAEAVDRYVADLVVVGTHGKSGVAAFWAGSVVQKLIRTLSTDFLLVPARGQH
jgi:nucleotide-binding universal stress UspA family protein